MPGEEALDLCVCVWSPAQTRLRAGWPGGFQPAGSGKGRGGGSDSLRIGRLAPPPAWEVLRPTDRAAAASVRPSPLGQPRGEGKRGRPRPTASRSADSGGAEGRKAPGQVDGRGAPSAPSRRPRQGALRGGPAEDSGRRASRAWTAPPRLPGPAAKSPAPLSAEGSPTGGSVREVPDGAELSGLPPSPPLTPLLLFFLRRSSEPPGQAWRAPRAGSP